MAASKLWATKVASYFKISTVNRAFSSGPSIPFNLNGSPLGVAAICSPDGRHLAIMPHRERCFLMWQYPWYPKNWNVDKKGPSPWLKMFQNARDWCS